MLPALLLLAPCFCPGRSLRVVGTDPSQPFPELTGHAEILNNLGLEEEEELTVCARVRTHQFRSREGHGGQALISLGEFWLAGAYTALPCDSEFPGCTEYMRNLVPGWAHGKTFGSVADSSTGRFYKSWEPGRWYSYCFTASNSLGQARVFINGREEVRLESFLSGAGVNLRLLNNQELDSPAHGQLTELTVWSKVLSQGELTAWAGCGEVGGDTVLAWDSLQLEVKGLQEEEVDRREICSELTKEDQVVVFDESQTFDGILSFCAKLGGQMAVGRDNSSTSRLVKVFSQNCQVTDEYFYSGFTDREEDGVWREVNSGQEMSWSNWGEDHPTNLKNDDCTFIDTQDGKVYNWDCVSEVGTESYSCNLTFLSVSISELQN